MRHDAPRMFILAFFGSHSNPCWPPVRNYSSHPASHTQQSTRAAVGTSRFRPSRNSDDRIDPRSLTSTAPPGPSSDYDRFVRGARSASSNDLLVIPEIPGAGQ